MATAEARFLPAQKFLWRDCQPVFSSTIGAAAFGIVRHGLLRLLDMQWL
jgi:hypothetical protein